MEEKVRRDVAALFGQNSWGDKREYVSLKLLDDAEKPVTINLELLDKMQTEKTGKEDYISLDLLYRFDGNDIRNHDRTDRISRIVSLRMLDNVVEDNYVNLNILEKPAVDEVIHLGILEMPVAAPHEKCHLLSPMMECNVGGFAHMGCMDQHFHSHCNYKALHEKREKLRTRQ